MRKLHGKTTLSDPLGLSRRKELIDDALSSVGKVTELSFPDDVRVGVDHGITKLESENTVLRKGGIADSVFTLAYNNYLGNQKRLLPGPRRGWTLGDRCPYPASGNEEHDVDERKYLARHPDQKDGRDFHP